MTFEALKQTMSETSMLALPYFNEKFILETNASGVGMDVVLI